MRHVTKAWISSSVTSCVKLVLMSIMLRKCADAGRYMLYLAYFHHPKGKRWASVGRALGECWARVGRALGERCCTADHLLSILSLYLWAYIVPKTRSSSENSTWEGNAISTWGICNIKKTQKRGHQAENGRSFDIQAPWSKTDPKHASQQRLAKFRKTVLQFLWPQSRRNDRKNRRRDRHFRGLITQLLLSPGAHVVSAEP